MEIADRARLDRTERWFVLALTAWAAVAFAAAYGGLFRVLPSQLTAPLVVAGIVVPVLVYYRSARLRDWIASIDPKHLTLFHLWRIPAGLAFLYYGRIGLLPEVFASNAGYGDVVVGLLVPIVLLLPGGLGKYLAFHVFSLLDFVVAVGTGLALTALDPGSMAALRDFPIALIPQLGVGVAGALSVMTIDSLLRRRAGRERRGALPAPGRP